MKLGAAQADVKNQFGDHYVEVLSSLDNRQMWRYDFIAKEGYVFENETVDGVDSDNVDVEGLENDSMRIQLFISWTDAGKALNYAFFYKGTDGKIYNYRFNSDGKIQIK